MGPAIRIALFAAAIAIAMAPAHAQTRSLNFIDISGVTRESIPLRFELPEDPFAARPETFVGSDGPPSPDPSLDQPVSRLTLDGAGLRNIPGMLRIGASQDDYPLIEFRVAGTPLSMALIEARPDNDFRATHYTLLAVDSDDYARISVSNSENFIVGTVFIEDLEYRILPESEEFQLVYPVLLQGKQWRREYPPDFDDRADLLEARHLQMGWVAEHRPDDFATLADGRPQFYRGESLGILHIWDALRNVDAAGQVTIDEKILHDEAWRFLNNIPHFTWLYEPVEFEILPEFETEQAAILARGFQIDLVQHIDGVPLSRTFRLSIDPTGEVIEYSGILMRRDMAESANGFMIDQEEARATAKQAMLNQYGLETNEGFLDERHLYQATSDTNLELVWIMTMEATCGMSFNVEINGITGEVSRVSLGSAGNFEAPVFRGFGRQTIEDYIMTCRFYGNRR